MIDERLPPVGPPPPPILRSSNPPPTPRSRNVRSYALPVAIGLAAFIAGYFAGREYVKHELRGAFHGLADGASAAARGILGFGGSSSTSDPPMATLNLGKSHEADGLRLVLRGARIDRFRMRVIGNETLSADEVLILSFDVRNTDDRRMLNYSGVSSGVSLVDDVENDISRMYFAGVIDIIGQMSELKPSSACSHIEVFAVPLPKTEHLILTINLAVFGKQGSLEFKILASEIENF